MDRRGWRYDGKIEVHKKNNMKKTVVVLTMVTLFLFGVMLISCKQPSIFSISEFYVDKSFCKDHLVPEKLYRIDTQEEMNVLFPDGSLYSLDSIDFTKHTVLVVYGVVPGNFTQNVELEKTQPNEYSFRVRISVGIISVASSTWAAAFITNCKLSKKENVTLDLSIVNPDKCYE